MLLTLFLKLCNDLCITPGVFCGKGALDCNDSGIKLFTKKSSKKVNKRRKVVRHLSEKYYDSTEEKKGVCYESGGS